MLRPSAALEALLFASGEPLEKKRVCTLLAVTNAELPDVVHELHTALVDRGLSLIETERELELRSAPDATPLVQKLREHELARDLGKAGLEALAVILYRGSATRGEIDWIRGVNSSATVRSLLMRGLIESAEDTADRRRLRYRATPEALAHLGVSRAEELPHYTELTQALADAQADTAPAEAL